MQEVYYYFTMLEEHVSMKESQDFGDAKTPNPCPNCGAFLEPTAKICPHCGAETNFVWPPPPQGSDQGDPKPTWPWEARNQINSGAMTGCGLGCVMQIGLLFLVSVPIISRLLNSHGTIVSRALVHGPPIFVLAMLYFLVRGPRPFFARGVGYSILAALFVSLGAAAVCNY